MGKWLLHRDEAISETEVPVHNDQEMRCTPSGQVLLLPKAKSIFDLYREEADRWASQRRRWQAEWAPGEFTSRIRRITGIRRLDELAPLKAIKVGRLQQQGVSLDKLILRPADGVVLPALYYRPEKACGSAVLYLNGEGKQAIDGGSDPWARRIQRGDTCALAVDLRGLGETATLPWRYRAVAEYLGNNSAEYFIAYMLGRSLVAMRAEDVLLSARYLASTLKAPREIHLVATGAACVPAWHAAALEPELFTSFQQQGGIVSWQATMARDVNVGLLENTVHGALQVYDLPDLDRLIQPIVSPDKKHSR